MYSEDVAVELIGVSKKFEIYSQPRDQLKQLIKPIWERISGEIKQNYYTDFKALNEIQLCIRKGESLGLIGRNGSGKSTLLQIIAGTLSPSAGDVKTFGRVGALLELGSGFNPEFSGRDNIVISAAILGLNDNEIAERIDSIIRFADIGEHLDRPVRTYSSGMLVRLAFAVQIRLDPDILIIDEALAVGDALFQKKCLDELQRLNESGVTLIVVSHDANSIKNLCDKAVLLEKGEVLASGEVKSVFTRYELLLHNLDVAGQEKKNANSAFDSAISKTPNVENFKFNDAKIVEFNFYDAKKNYLKSIPHGKRLYVHAKILIGKELSEPAYGLLVRDIYGRSIFEASTYSMRVSQKPVMAGDVVTVVFNFEVTLGVGRFYFSFGVANKGYGQSEFEEHVLLEHDIAALEVIQSDEDYYFGGVVDLHPEVQVNCESA